MPCILDRVIEEGFANPFPGSNGIGCFNGEGIVLGDLPPAAKVPLPTDERTLLCGRPGPVQTAELAEGAATVLFGTLFPLVVEALVLLAAGPQARGRASPARPAR